LRRLRAANDAAKLQRYILGLSLVAATEPLDGYLRQGCLLVPKPEARNWESVGRDGQRTAVVLSNAEARRLATRWAAEFGVGENRTVNFDRALAKADVAAKEGNAGAPKAAADKKAKKK